MRDKALPDVYLLGLFNAFPEERDCIIETIENGVSDLDRLSFKNAARRSPQPEYEFPQIEKEAFPWAVTFRTRFLLERIAYLARSVGLQPERIRQDEDEISYGLVLTKGEDKLDKVVSNSFGDILFPCSRVSGFRFQAGDVILLGSPFKHPLVEDLVEIFFAKFSEILKVRLEFHVSDEHPLFFGYPTSFVNLYVEDKEYCPQRYVDRQDAIHYEDYGLILRSPLSALVDEKSTPFKKESSHILIIAGAHRLATGFGVRFFLEDQHLSSLIMKKPLSPNEPGALLYKVVVRNGGNPQTEEESLLFGNPIVENLEVLEQWPKT
jgi:hypothetical protein